MPTVNLTGCKTYATAKKVYYEGPNQVSDEEKEYLLSVVNEVTGEPWFTGETGKKVGGVVLKSSKAKASEVKEQESADEAPGTDESASGSVVEV